MATSPTPQRTDFSDDVIGRYVCNGLDEARRSADPSLRPDARPFDIVVLGGGTFGAALAQHLFHLDRAHRHRVLVLEAGPFLLPEHVQNLPMLGLGVPGPTSIAQLRAARQEGQARNEVWGLPWHSSTPFVGLAYCVGGRSLFWGGWSPQLLDAEMPVDGTVPSPWPRALVDALDQVYFPAAAEQIGVTESNYFIFGELQNALRQQLFDGITAGGVPDAIALDTLPDHPAVRSRGARPTLQDLLMLLGLPAGGRAPAVEDLLNQMKLEAPLGVQVRTRSGLFPFNKFSAVPLLIHAARMAESESGGDDVKKRLMVVPNCHVQRLITTDGRVREVQTNQGIIAIPPEGGVILALGTIESARLALVSFGGLPHAELIGRNFMAHVRSNLTIRIPRESLAGLDPAVAALQAAALFVKGRHRQADGTASHFHLQISAAGLDALGTDSEAELFKKVPDIDTFEAFRAVQATHIVITIRGIGEMEPRNPQNFVGLDRELDEFGVPRAIVGISPSARDLTLWDAMDRAADDVARVLAGSRPYEVLTPAGPLAVPARHSASEAWPYARRRDSLGTTHHEAGTLWMGEDKGRSVTNPDARFHAVANAHAAGPALHPTVGSPNPMLTGIALVRRLAEHLVPAPAPYQPGDGFEALFDGINTDNWRMAGRGRFLVMDGTLEAQPGDDLGLYWCTTPTPADFVLRLEWLRRRQDDNSGVFIRFPDPMSKGYDNPAYVGVQFGFEVQIDELGPPDGADIHKTGAIYNEPTQTLNWRPSRPVGEWNEFEIDVQGQTYTVRLNGAQVTTFTNPHPDRGLPSRAGAYSYIGLQSHTGHVAFRNIGIKVLVEAPRAVRRAREAAAQREPRR